VCAVCDVTYVIFMFSSLKFFDIIGIFFYTHSPYFCKNQGLYTPLIIKFL